MKDKLFGVFTPPFKYDKYGQKIFDANNNLALDIRGAGLFVYLNNSDQMQDYFGKWVADKMNEEVKK